MNENKPMIFLKFYFNNIKMIEVEQSYHLLIFFSRSFDGAQNVCPDKATSSIVDDPVSWRNKLEVDRLGRQPPETTHAIGDRQLLLQLWGEVVFTLAPAHVGEEAEEEGDGEHGLVQHHLDGDDPGGGGHEPGVQPAVPERHVAGSNDISPARQVTQLGQVKLLSLATLRQHRDQLWNNVQTLTWDQGWYFLMTSCWASSAPQNSVP